MQEFAIHVKMLRLLRSVEASLARKLHSTKMEDKSVQVPEEAQSIMEVAAGGMKLPGSFKFVIEERIRGACTHGYTYQI